MAICRTRASSVKGHQDTTLMVLNTPHLQKYLQVPCDAVTVRVTDTPDGHLVGNCLSDYLLVALLSKPDSPVFLSDVN